MGKQQYSIATITIPTPELMSQWKYLWKNASNATVFNSPEWFVTCQKQEKSKNFFIVGCFEKNRLVGIIPLRKSKKYGISVVGCLDTCFQVDTAFLVESYTNDLLQELFSYLIKNYNLYLPKNDNNASMMLHELYPHMFFSLLSVNPCIPLTVEPHETISPKLLKRIKKIIKDNNDSLHFTLHTDNLEKHIKEMIAVDLNSWKQQKGKSVFKDKKTQQFYKTLAKECSEFARVGILYFNETPIAYFFGFLYGKTFAAYQTSFLYEYKQYRPGQTALYLLMENLKDKANVIDMGGGISRYKQEFTKDYRVLYDLFYSENLAIMYWFKTVNFARRMRQILFPVKNTQDHKFLFKSFQKETASVSLVPLFHK